MDITINGVSFNVDAVKKISFDSFIVHSMHEYHWPHLKQADHDKAIAEAYDIIQGYGNTNTDDGKGGADAIADITDSTGFGNTDKGGISRPQRLATRQGSR